ncbi:hypothetical protein TRFO_32705 [Tritrichomonas foetus]|uniref:Uncharacterized protein n=1 Tax=Tritrichomonas foetus TaxID=1144522 RepID=A0A1J4JN90_9EUKA|nr:hypothetical protein TRFO_32705 [Tritrichomonas foetus]|eukprot:OHT00593.1 hypothetical protein TRFO_32705 [Tritrichomonas foetus]
MIHEPNQPPVYYPFDKNGNILKVETSSENPENQFENDISIQNKYNPPLSSDSNNPTNFPESEDNPSTEDDQQNIGINDNCKTLNAIDFVDIKNLLKKPSPIQFPKLILFDKDASFLKVPPRIEVEPFKFPKCL